MKKRKLLVLAALPAGAAMVLTTGAWAQTGAQANLDMSPDEEQAHVVRILRTSNKAQINRYAGKVYDFNNVNPGQINNFFHSTLFMEEGAAYTFVNPDGESGKIMVVCPEYQLPYFDELVGPLDQPNMTSAPGSKYTYTQLKHRNAADAQFVSIAQQYASPNSVVLGDVETNALFCFDSPSGSDYLARYLEEYLDTPTPVVNLNVTIYEVVLNNDGTLGLDYEDFKNGPYQGMLVGVASYTRVDGYEYDDASGVLEDSAEGYRQSRSSASIIDIQFPSAYLDFLVEKGKARVMTETQLATSSMKPAQLFTGEQILFYQENMNRDTWTRTVNGAISAQDVGVDITFTPVIGSEMIELDTDVRVTSLNGFTEAGNPIINTREAETVATVADGGEVVLGGMVRERVSESTYKVPVLGSLPLVGWLFGGETQINQKSMLVMVVKPAIDRTYANVAAADEDIMNEAMGSMRPSIPDAAFGYDMWLLDNE